MALAVKWAWRYSREKADWYDSLDEAIRAAGWAADDARESLGCIEVWEDDGTHRIVSEAEVWSLYAKYQVEQRAKTPPPPPIVAELHLRDPEGRDVVWSTYYEREKADATAEKLRPFFGDRVWVEDTNGDEETGGKSDG